MVHAPSPTGGGPRPTAGCSRLAGVRIRRRLARAYWAVSRWRLRSQPLPDDDAGILIGAPHTSNWDFLLMLAIAWDSGMSLRFLGKESLFRAPFGGVMRALGGIPVDRSDPHGVVDEVVGRLRAGERFYLAITPEGTRSKAAYWKSGFYRMAREADLPVVLGYVDRTTRTTGFGPTLRMTGDVRADMDRIRAFYADKAGIKPALRTEPRLREEPSAPSS